MFKRAQLIQLHMFFAALILPILLMYFISGILYTYDIKGHIEKKKFDVVLIQPIDLDMASFAALTEQELLKHNLVVPDGEMSLKKKKSTYSFRWGGLGYAVTVKTTRKPNVLSMTVRNRDLLTQVMRIHRADAGSVFKILPSVLLVGMLLVLLSGIHMALGIPKFRKPVLYTMGVSTALSFIAFVVK